MTLLLYTRRKGWPLDSVTVECSHERVHCRDAKESEEAKDTYIELMKRNVRLQCDLTEAQRARLAVLVRRCPVHRTLTSTLEIEDRVELVS